MQFDIGQCAHANDRAHFVFKRFWLKSEASGRTCHFICDGARVQHAAPGNPWSLDAAQLTNLLVSPCASRGTLTASTSPLIELACAQPNRQNTPSAVMCTPPSRSSGFHPLRVCDSCRKFFVAQRYSGPCWPGPRSLSGKCKSSSSTFRHSCWVNVVCFILFHDQKANSVVRDSTPQSLCGP